MDLAYNRRCPAWGNLTWPKVGEFNLASGDIDAALFERSSNCLYLFQMKWSNVFALSLRERRNRMLYLAKANTWIEQTTQWVASSGKQEVLSRLCLDNKGIDRDDFEIRLVVLARFTARFSGTTGFDQRAAWISWPSLSRLVEENRGKASPLEEAFCRAMASRKVEEHGTDTDSSPVEYHFPDLKVDVFS